MWENEGDSTIEYDTARELTRQLDYYKNVGVTTDNYNGANKGEYCWLRSASSHNPVYFYYVDGNGAWRYDYASSVYGLAVAFRL